MREQIAQQPPAKQAVKYDKYPERRFHLNADGELVEDTPVPPYRSHAPKPDDTICIDDETFYNERQNSSVVRRGKIPPTAAQTRTVMRVTRHAEPPVQRASRTTTPQPQAKQKPVQQTQKRFHRLFYVGCGMLGMLALWTIGSSAFSWLQAQHDNSVYGYPRTFQIDVNVGHQGVSHFIAENLHGDIVVIEVHPSNLAETKIYQGPTFSGAGTDLQPATLSFQDVNSDGKPDMVISVGNGRYILINTGSTFRPTTSADHINGV